MAASLREGGISIDGRRLAWRSLGQGPPLLLLNGYSATAADWDPGFLVGLARRSEVICPDNRGFGGSDLGSGELSVDGMASDALALLDALGHERATIAGWSMGGFVAQRLAVRAPERVAGLALLGTDPGGAAAVAPSPEAWARLIDHTGTPREQATRLLSVLFPANLLAGVDRQFGDLVAAARAKLDPAALVAQEAALLEWHEGKGAGEAPSAPLTFPVAIGHGGLDEVIPAANAAALARRWPGASVEVLPSCAHALMAQEPAAVAATVAGVLPESG